VVDIVGSAGAPHSLRAKEVSVHGAFDAAREMHVEMASKQPRAVTE
jgi:hypothetical protein